MRISISLLLIVLLAAPYQVQGASQDSTKTPKVEEAKAKTSHRTVADTTQTEPAKEQKPIPQKSS